MQVSPKLIVTRFEQLKSGDLFIYLNDRQSCIALVAEDPEANGEKLILPLGPHFPPEVGGPRLLAWEGATVVSIGNAYEVRLPMDPRSWSEKEPTREKHCILLVDNTVYFRANFHRDPKEFKACYVKANDGIVSYNAPRGIRAYTVDWEITTPDTKGMPRTILKMPT